ncbi:MAG: TetR/AcrR family transcriptional regulator; helix-turn-helix transcriptional regulator [Spirochaetales bacterium]|nr:TetR/AcrR family transcriptional regulator; helix-turn-helix transcriptional regulator [Spirochaetales bacterium]
MNACIKEFSDRGYEAGATDRIIEQAGISKGGLYEYISSKRELFLYTVEYSYRRLYGYLTQRILDESIRVPNDLIERLRIMSELAIDFYIEHPRYVQLLATTYRMNDTDMQNHIQRVFQELFLELFGDVDEEFLRFRKQRLLEFAMWLLFKTRFDFLVFYKESGDMEKTKALYMERWEFYLELMKHGIYR